MGTYRIEFHITHYGCCGRTKYQRLTEEVEAGHPEEARAKLHDKFPKARIDSITLLG